MKHIERMNAIYRTLSAVRPIWMKDIRFFQFVLSLARGSIKALLQQHSRALSMRVNDSEMCQAKTQGFVFPLGEPSSTTLSALYAQGLIPV